MGYVWICSISKRTQGGVWLRFWCLGGLDTIHVQYICSYNLSTWMLDNGFHVGKYIQSSHRCVWYFGNLFSGCAAGREIHVKNVAVSSLPNTAPFSGWVNRWDCYFELMKLNQGKREETGDISMADPWCFSVGGFHICGCKNQRNLFVRNFWKNMKIQLFVLKNPWCILNPSSTWRVCVVFQDPCVTQWKKFGDHHLVCIRHRWCDRLYAN